MEGDCLLLGRRDNPYIFMKHAKLFIHTSLSEGLPTVFLESMVCGTPVVAMDCPTGPRDILGNGEFGALIPLGNKTEFVNRVYALLNNDIERNTYIHRLPESIARFNIDRVSNELEKLLVRVSESVKQWNNYSIAIGRDNSYAIKYVLSERISTYLKPSLSEKEINNLYWWLSIELY